MKSRNGGTTFITKLYFKIPEKELSESTWPPLATQHCSDGADGGGGGGQRSTAVGGLSPVTFRRFHFHPAGQQRRRCRRVNPVGASTPGRHRRVVPLRPQRGTYGRPTLRCVGFVTLRSRCYPTAEGSAADTIRLRCCP